MSKGFDNIMIAHEHRRMTTMDDTEELVNGSITMTADFAHMFDGFYTQTGELEIYEEAFKQKCKTGGGAAFRYADETLAALKNSTISMGVSVDNNGILTIEKFFTSLGETKKLLGKDQNISEGVDLNAENARSASPTEGGAKPKRQTLQNVHEDNLKRCSKTGLDKIVGGMEIKYVASHGDAGGHRQDLKPSLSHGWPGTYSIFKLSNEHKNSGDYHKNVGKTLQCCLKKDSNTNLSSEGYDWVVTCIAGEAIGEEGPTIVQVSEVTFDGGHDIVWSCQLKQIAAHHTPKLGGGGCGCVVS